MAEKRKRTELKRKVELERLFPLKPMLKELEDGHLPFMCLQYNDKAGFQHLLPAVYLGKASDSDSFAFTVDGGFTRCEHDVASSYHAALGSDNLWYLFTEKWIRTIYRTGFPNIPLVQGDDLPREIMTMLLDKGDMQWQKVVESELGGLWSMEGSLETWSWSLNVPVLSSLSEDDEVLKFSRAYYDAVESYKDQRNKVSRLKKRIGRTEGFKEYKKILDTAKFHNQ